jgi:beta-galactosidase
VGLNGVTVVAPDTWHHVAGVYDGQEVKLYVDGKLDSKQSWTQGIGRNNADVLIGENAERKGRCFDGLLDDVRIYNYALSESEIKALAEAQIAAK